MKAVSHPPPPSSAAASLRALAALLRPRPTGAAISRALGGRLLVGRLGLRLPNGQTLAFEGDEADRGPEAAAVIHRLRALRRMTIGGEAGLADAYIDGDWSSPNLVALLELGERNEDAFRAAGGGWSIPRLARRWRHRRNDNCRRGSRRNVSAHYDLGNAFYAQWLDRSMTYSSALFRTGAETLEEAQREKYLTLARDIGLKPGQKVLEIGCGWGGFAEVAARDFGAYVTALTLSAEQAEWARARLCAAGLGERVDILLQDYREASGAFDAIVSIEMIEAVGERWWPTYFRSLFNRLKRGGGAAAQAITIADDRFESYRKGCDFIQSHIFPGGMLPSLAKIQEHARAAGLSCEVARSFGRDYDRTLATWEKAFKAKWETIAALGFDQAFRRLWEFYLAYCRAGFRCGAIDVRHVLMRKPL